MLARSGNLYSVIIGLVLSAVITHVALSIGPVHSLVERGKDALGISGSLLRFLLWLLGTALLFRPFTRLAARIPGLGSSPVAKSVIKSEDLSVRPGTRTNMLPGYREKLGKLCSALEPRIIEFVNGLISAGFSLNASDIYLSPKRDTVNVSFRLHGQLYDLLDLDRDTYLQVVNRIKVLSHLTLFRHEDAQDGLVRFEDPAYTARVSILPTNHGERVALRLVSSHSEMFHLDSIGMPQTLLETYKALLNRNQGMIILTGPTGSGKSTTMFAGLLEIHRLRGENVNIVTLEDPIERDFELFHQTKIDPLSNMTFSRGLRSVLRQDPDVIMLGEIRDEETALSAMRAAMTGHLLLTTVHASSTAGVFDRLMQMGISPAQLSSAVHAVIAQRLCHCLCDNCKHQSPPDESLIRQLRLMGLEQTPEGPFYVADGCDECLGKGYTHRRAIFEMLVLSDSLRDTIAQGKPSHQIYREARAGGMQTLYEHGLQLAREGIFSLSEVVRMSSS
jgi:general secretion pathway protein E